VVAGALVQRLPERRRWQRTSKGNKAHGRIGCRRLATGVDTTDSSVEQHPEVDCSGTEAIAQAPAWSAPRHWGNNRVESRQGSGQTEQTLKDTDTAKPGDRRAVKAVGTVGPSAAVSSRGRRRR